jgi:raffinose/stachyose/melibiose transport system permease protein
MKSERVDEMQEKGLTRWTSRFVFLSPAMLIYGFMVLLPIVMSIYYSFFDWNGVAPKVFSGLHNFQTLLKDTVMFTALFNSLKLTFWAVIIQLPAGLFLAMLLSTKIKGGNFFKTVYFLPVMLSTVVLGILWGQIYDPNIGLLNQFLMKIGLESWVQTWLGDEKYALASIIAVVAWQYIGFYVVVYFAALQNIPEEIIESAKIEGASEWLMLIKIRLPLIWPVVMFTVLNAVVNSLRYFDLVYIMTKGGPNNSSEVIATYMVKQMLQFLDYGYGSAISAFLFFFSLAIALLLGKLLNREPIEY